MTHSPPRSTVLLGIGLVLLSAVGLAAQNVILRLFFSTKMVLGLFSFGGLVAPQMSNIIFLLALRMMSMSVILAAIAPALYPKTVAELRSLVQTPSLLRTTLASGFCLCCGLTLLYLALSQVATGIAIATFFIYPAITVLLAWRIFHQRPQRYKLWLMGIILGGVALLNWLPASAIAAAEDTTTNPTLGIVSALGASVGFGVYGILTEIGLRPQAHRPYLHPVPFSLMVFSIVAVLSSITLLGLQVGPQPLAIAQDNLGPVIVMTILSAVLTLVAYVLNNFGVRYIGAALTGLITATVPVLTALFAWFSLQEGLQAHQLIGVAIVTGGVAVLSIKAQQ